MAQPDQEAPSRRAERGIDVPSKASDDPAGAHEKLQQAAGQAQQSAQQAAGEIQDRVRQQIDQRSTQAAEQIKQQGSDLRSVSESLRKEGKDGPAKAADRLADYAERISGYLSEKDSHGLLSDAEDFGRKQPWAAAAGGLALGFAASRFLKASSSERYRSRPSQSSASPALTRGTGAQSGPTPYAGAGSVTPGAAPGVV